MHRGATIIKCKKKNGLNDPSLEFLTYVPRSAKHGSLLLAVSMLVSRIGYITTPRSRSLPRYPHCRVFSSAVAVFTSRRTETRASVGGRGAM